MVCTRCATEAPATASFCSRCGQWLASTPPVENAGAGATDPDTTRWIRTIGVLGTVWFGGVFVIALLAAAGAYTYEAEAANAVVASMSRALAGAIVLVTAVPLAASLLLLRRHRLAYPLFLVYLVLVIIGDLSKMISGSRLSEAQTGWSALQELVLVAALAGVTWYTRQLRARGVLTNRLAARDHEPPPEGLVLR
jgi:hypothetical protein